MREFLSAQFSQRSQRPPWDQMTSSQRVLSIVLPLRDLFMVTKGLVFVAKSIQLSFLYKKTYGTWNQFEVIFLLLCSFKILLLMPDVFLYEINWLFYALALNSGLAYTLSYILHERQVDVLEMKGKRTKLPVIWYSCRMVFLAFVMITPLFEVGNDDTHFLTCEDPNVIYRKLYFDKLTHF